VFFARSSQNDPFWTSFTPAGLAPLQTLYLPPQMPILVKITLPARASRAGSAAEDFEGEEFTIINELPINNRNLEKVLWIMIQNVIPSCIIY
jgi:hypothetical protein